MNTPHLHLATDTAIRMTLDVEPWLSCDDCFHLIDHYIESLLDGDGPMPAMRSHLIGCAACAEEARTLVVLACNDDGLDPQPVLRMLPED